MLVYNAFNAEQFSIFYLICSSVHFPVAGNYVYPVIYVISVSAEVNSARVSEPHSGPLTRLYQIVLPTNTCTVKINQKSIITWP